MEKGTDRHEVVAIYAACPERLDTRELLKIAEGWDIVLPDLGPVV